MGCHTWCYKRLNLTDEVKRQYQQSALEEVKYFIDREYTNDFSKKDIAETDKFRDSIIKEGVLDKILKGDLDTIMEWKAGYLISKIGDSYYDSDEMPHDPFRVSGYPEGHWYDADSLINFLREYDQEKIEDPDGNVGLTSKLEEVIRELFKTVDMIDFG